MPSAPPVFTLPLFKPVQQPVGYVLIGTVPKLSQPVPEE
jgi:hypothetical protein